MQTKNAERVLPEPVGAEMRGWFVAQDGGPSGDLGFGGRAELGEEPLLHDGMSPGEIGVAESGEFRGWERLGHGIL